MRELYTEENLKEIKEKHDITIIENTDVQLVIKIKDLSKIQMSYENWRKEKLDLITIDGLDSDTIQVGYYESLFGKIAEIDSITIKEDNGYGIVTIKSALKI